MMHYRDDLDAARARIETLEAKLKERDAALLARDAEIAEMRGEIGRLARGEPSASGVSDERGVQRALLVALAACGFVMTAGYTMVRPLPGEAWAPRTLPLAQAVVEVDGRGDAQGVALDQAQFDRAAARSALRLAAKEVAARCSQEGDEPGRSLQVTVVFEPNGAVSSADVAGEPMPVAGCMAETFKRARVPPFAGPPVKLSRLIRWD